MILYYKEETYGFYILSKLQTELVIPVSTQNIIKIRASFSFL